MDFDSSLNLEAEYQQKGYEDGYKDGTRQGLVEGRIYGAEKAYERFSATGLCYGRLSVWRLEHNDQERISRHLDKAEDLLSRIPLTNREVADNMDFDSIMSQVYAKFRLIASLCGDESLVKSGIIQETVGQGDLEDGAELAVRLRGSVTGKGCSSA